MDVMLSKMGESLKKELGLLLNKYDSMGVTAEEIYKILDEKTQFAKFCAFGRTEL